MRKPNIFLDLDGTLLDIFDRYWTVHAFSVARVRKIPIARSLYVRLRRKGYYEKRIYRERYGMTFREQELAYNVWERNLESKQFLKRDVLSPGIKDLLKRLSAFYGFVLISDRANAKNSLWQLRNLKIVECFEDIRFVGGVYGKPGKKWESKYREIRRRQYALSRSVVIGDTESEIVTGKKLGISSFAVSNGLRTRTYLLSCAPSRIFLDVGSALRALPRFHSL